MLSTEKEIEMRRVALNSESTIFVETDLPAPVMRPSKYKARGEKTVECSLCDCGYRVSDAAAAQALADAGLYTPVCTTLICSCDLADLQIAAGL